MNSNKKIATPLSQYGRQFYEKQKEGSRSSAMAILPILFDIIRTPKSVIDVGCGVGTWLSACMEFGVKNIVGVDGPWVDQAQLQIPIQNFHQFDLSKEFVIPGKYDLAISFETAEHLSSRIAPSFVNSLTQLSNVVLFSAAIPGQGGESHVNEQWPSFWGELFKAKGFCMLDPLRKKIWNDERVEWWYQQNMFLYVNAEYYISNSAINKIPQITVVP